MSPERVAAIVRDLADGCSTQARVANRTWLGVIAVSVVLLLGTSAAALPGCPQVAHVPLLGEIPTAQLVPIAFAMLSILVIALAAAHAEHVRADALAHEAISKLEADNNGPDPRSLLDILRVPGFTRVAPIALWVRGGWKQKSKRRWVRTSRRITGGLLYLLLKALVVVVLFAIPGIALWESYQRVRASSLSHLTTLVLGALMWIALLSLVLIGLADLGNTWTRVRKFFDAAT